MAQRLSRKLVNVYGTLESAAPVHRALAGFLEAHRIGFERHWDEDRDGDEYLRYTIHIRDLAKAREILPYLKTLTEALPKPPVREIRVEDIGEIHVA